MNHAEAVSRAQDWLWRAYPDGYVTDKNKDALSVLRSVEPLVEAAMRYDPEDGICEELPDAALSLKERMEKGEEKRKC